MEKLMLFCGFILTNSMVIGQIFPSSPPQEMPQNPMLIDGNYQNGTYKFENNFIAAPNENIGTNTLTVGGHSQFEIVAGNSIKITPGANIGVFANNSNGFTNLRIEKSNFEVAWFEPIQNPGIVGKYEKVELGIKLSEEISQKVKSFTDWNRSFTFRNEWDNNPNDFPDPISNPKPNNSINPFDPEEISIEMELTSPSGNIYTRYGFFFRDFEMDPSNIHIPKQGNDYFTPNSTRKYRDYIEIPTEFNFRIRTSLNEIGEWKYKIKIILDGTQSGMDYKGRINCIGSENKGFVTVNQTNKWYLGYTDSDETFFPIGLNLEGFNEGPLNWRGTTNTIFEKFIDLAEGGCNFTEIWLNPNFFSFEREMVNNYDTDFYYLTEDLEGDCKKYCNRYHFGPDESPNTANVGCGFNHHIIMNRQINAKLVDRFIELAKEKNVKIQLALSMNGNDPGKREEGTEIYSIDDQANWEYDWKLSPYNCMSKINLELGFYNNCQGIYNPYFDLLTNQNKKAFVGTFFTGQEQKKYYKNFLRYLSARWGYSTNIASYELLQEIDFGAGHIGQLDFENETNREAIYNWTNEISNYLKVNLQDKHLISLSQGDVPLVHDNSRTTSSLNYNPYSLSNIDFTDWSHYQFNSSKQAIDYSIFRNKINQKFSDKPLLLGEVGQTIPGDYEGCTVINLHNSIWATVFSGAMGTGLNWFWESLYNRYSKKYYLNGLIPEGNGNDQFPENKPFLLFKSFRNFYDKYELSSFFKSNNLYKHSESKILYDDNEVPNNCNEGWPKIDYNWIRHIDIEGHNEIGFGWVHNAGYYVGRMPTFCPEIATQTPNPSDMCYEIAEGKNIYVQALNPVSGIINNENIEIDDILHVNRFYDVDFFNTWDNEAGILQEYKKTIFVGFDGNLIVEIPPIGSSFNESFNPLFSLSDENIFPDYAFKYSVNTELNKTENSNYVMPKIQIPCYLTDTLIVSSNFGTNNSPNANYSWFLNGQLVSSLKSPKISFPNHGDFVVDCTVKDDNQIYSYTCKYFVGNCTKSLSDGKFKCKLSPNPTNEEIGVYTDCKNCKFEIYNSLGNLISNTMNLIEGENRLNISSYTPGMYMIYIYNNEHVNSYRIIKF